MENDNTPEKAQEELLIKAERDLSIAFAAFFTGVFNNHIIRSFISKKELKPFFSGTTDDKIISNQIRQFLIRLNTYISSSLVKSWKNGDDHIYNEIKNKVSRRYFERALDTGIASNRDRALQAFIHGKRFGFTISERVWKIEAQIKHEIESCIMETIYNGSSAPFAVGRIKQYLKYPDKLFRRVRDEHGNLILSKAAKAFNPGQGVYRSSYKNALRLTKNEINVAYRTSTVNRMNSLPFVRGMKINLSDTHAQRMPNGDICDTLKGIYPAGFHWTGWHVGCLCYITSELVSEDDFFKFIETEEDPKKISELPKELKEWAKDKKYSKPGSLSWIDNNPEVKTLFTN